MYSHLKLVAETKNTHYFDYQQNVTSFAHAHRCLFWSCPDVNIPMRISDIGEMIVAICATRIMGGPVTARVPIKVIIFLLLRVALGTNQNRAHGLTSCDIVDELVRNIAITLWCNILDISALNSSGPVLHQTSGSFFASDPMVNVGFDHEFVAQFLPQVEFHSVVVCLADWSCGRYRDVTIGWPAGTWSNGVWSSPKTSVKRNAKRMSSNAKNIVFIRRGKNMNRHAQFILRGVEPSSGKGCGRESRYLSLSIGVLGVKPNPFVKPKLETS